jgi:hypothetical protein
LAHNLPLDLVKSAFMLTTADLARIVEAIVGHAYDLWGDDPRFGMFIERVRSIPASR